MKSLQLIRLNENENLIEKAAIWFSDKWNISKEAYQESMEQSLRELKKKPKWYVVLNDTGDIVAGVGIIDNDFHERKDLTPNVCALYVELEYRKQGIARFLLDTCRKEACNLGYRNLYLITDHIEFYEKCDWKFLMMVKSEDNTQVRMYRVETQLFNDSLECHILNQI